MFVPLRIKIVFSITLVVMLSGCATNSLFMPYPFQAVAYKQAIGLGDTQDSENLLDATLVQLEAQKAGDDAKLYLMERGRINQMAGRFEDSKRDFEGAIAAFEARDLSATLDVSDIGDQGLAVLLNDNAIPYRGAGYERILVHQHQAFNYLGLKDTQGAAVEFRKAALEQRVLLDQYDIELANVKNEAQEQDVDLTLADEQLDALKPLAKALKNSFQNAYTFYTSAIFWEATGEYNNALVDYKKAREVRPELSFINNDIKRLEQKQSRSYRSNKAQIFVLFEDSFIPEKSAGRMDWPTFDGGIISVSFPFYEPLNWPKSQTLSVFDQDTNELGRSEIIADMGAMAVKHLQEQFPAQLLRQILRGMAKYRLQKKSREELGLGGQFVANVFNVLSEQADRRSWLTLPNTAQVMRFELDNGSHLLKLATPTRESDLQLNINSARTVLLRVIHANQRLITQVYEL